ncbi:tolloid-like protein 1 [Branchiostoma floridae]|uniref:Metalloendopeptidase n=1 Tax=Branchiostoma floridae TaxID=7739 RepID=A0A9J7M4L8_BRAFL|nr:tolloid-like protein 1 [Branchiostoma floridae]
MLTVLAFVLAACGGDLTVTLAYEHDVAYNNLQLNNLQNRIILDPCASKDVLEGDIILDDWARDYHTVEYRDGGFVSRKTKSHRGRNEPTRNNKQKLHPSRPRKSRLRPSGAPSRSSRERRAATAVESRLWPGGVIPYVIDAGFSNESRSVIQSAMTHWQRNTCVRFRPRMHQDFDYVFFQRGRTCCSFVGRTGNGKQTVSVGPGCDMFGIVLYKIGHLTKQSYLVLTLSITHRLICIMLPRCCSFVGRTGNGKQTLSVGPGCDMFGIMLCCSFVGRTGNGKQTLSVGPGCDMFGIVLHEIGHLIGFWHEHSRPDRDDFVNILYENVKDGERHNFEKLWKTQINSLGQRYDYMSIMHYGSRYFTKNGRETLSPRQSNVMIGQRTALSQMDIVQANLLYKCHRVTDCGGTIFANSGNFTSPNYPNELPSNIGCAWIITSEEGNTITLNVTDMDLQGVEDGGECRNEYIEIRDGMGELAPLIGRFCGNDTPTSIASSGRSLWLQLVSRGPPVPPVDGTTHYSVSRGFAVSFEPGGVCERTLTEATGRIKSPSNIETSLQGIDCAWQIVVPEGYYVALTIENVQLPGYDRSDHQCHLHFVEILDGNSSDSTTINRLCHSSQGVGLISSGSHLRIILKSSPSLQHASFSASYTAIDIDECMSNNGGCQEACLNLDGGYACGCSYGYEIAPDGTSCVGNVLSLSYSIKI